jgi:hypothetical protein
MSYTLEQFVADSRSSLSNDPGPAGREKVRQGLEKLLANPDFIASVISIDPSERVRILHADPDLGFRILAHVSDPHKSHAPHNHGNSWAIYGQVQKFTEMTEWERNWEGAEDNSTPLQKKKSYRLLPGQAGTYENGAIHSVSNPEGGRIIRITGTDLDKIHRERFDAETGKAENMRASA